MPNFKTPEFGGIRMEAGSNRFYISINKFIERATEELQSLNKTNVEQQFKRLATKYPAALQ